MPYRHNYRRKRTRKRIPRKRTIVRRRRYIPDTPFPTRRMAKLRYVQSVQLAPTTGAAAIHSFRANSLFDPDLTGTGHQPYGFDQLMGVYNHYTVLGAKITVTFQNEGATALADNLVVGTLLNDDNVGSTDPSLLREYKNSKYCYLNAGGSGQAKTCVKTFSAKKFFGKKNVVGAADYRGTSLTNPNELAIFWVWAAPNSTLDDPVGCTAGVTIEYIAMFTEIRSLPQS